MVHKELLTVWERLKFNLTDMKTSEFFRAAKAEDERVVLRFLRAGVAERHG